MILIYMNTEEWGGVDQFVQRFAEYLRRVDYNFIIVDKLQSRLRTDLPWAGFLTTEELRRTSQKFDYVFIPSVSKLKDVKDLSLVNGDARMFTWIVQHHDALYHFFPPSQRIVPRFGFKAAILAFRFLPGHKRRTEALFDMLTRHRALAVMDGSTLRSFRAFFPKATPPSALIPLPVPLGPSYDGDRLKSDVLTVGYLGRMDYFKFSALAPFIRTELARIAGTRQVKLVAITVGTHVRQLEQLCTACNIALELHGFMPNDQAREILACRTHFAVAMGTAALDIAAVGHPCVFIDPAEKKNYPPQRRFRFVHEAQDYMVGEFRDFPGYVGGLHSLEKVIEMAQKSNSRLANLERDYVQTRHDPETINSQILEGITSSKLYLSIAIEKIIWVKYLNDRLLSTLRFFRNKI